MGGSGGGGIPLIAFSETVGSTLYADTFNCDDVTDIQRLVSARTRVSPLSQATSCASGTCALGRHVLWRGSCAIVVVVDSWGL